jgi:hypothetical protein
MTISIPQSVFDTYNDTMDYMLANDNFSRSCTIYYPPLKEACSCTLDQMGGGTNNHYQHGGPAPFNFSNNCGYCGGAGFREKEQTDSIRLRLYWNSRNWIKTKTLVLPDTKVQIIGFMSDLRKLLNAASIRVINEEKAFDQRLVLAGDPVPHGFGRTRYFLAFLK